MRAPKYKPWIIIFTRSNVFQVEPCMTEPRLVG